MDTAMAEKILGDDFAGQLGEGLEKFIQVWTEVAANFCCLMEVEPNEKNH